MTSRPPASAATAAPLNPTPLPQRTQVVVVGGGPTGSAAAIHAANAGLEVVLVDAATFPRDKTCGDGLTPRAIAELQRLGVSERILHRSRNNGLKLYGFGGAITAPWPQGNFPNAGAAMRRTEFDHLLLQEATHAGARVFDGHAVVGIERGNIGAGRTGVRAVTVRDRNGQVHNLATDWLLVADGVRSVIGKQLGRVWHRDSVFGVAARSYVTLGPEADANWIHSHLELRGADGESHPGYGWIFPLGDGTANLGCGALSTSARPTRANVKKLLHDYHAQVQQEFGLGTPTSVTSALLPMGGAVSQVAGPNWALLGDAAALVNPLNGEGIDYGMESARLAVELLVATAAGHDGLAHAWPALLREHYGAGFALARTLALALTYPKLLPTVGPLTIGARWGEPLMAMAARLMGNLVTDADRDVVARLWRLASRGALLSHPRQPWQ